jgi:hypothetical protein
MKGQNLTAQLDLSGGNVLEIMLGAKDVQARYDAALKLLQEKAEPVIWAYLKGQNVQALVESKTTVKELEELEIELLPKGFNELLAETIESLDFTLVAKAYLFGLWLQTFTNASINYFKEMMRIRTEIIMRKEAGAKSRIITLN